MNLFYCFKNKKHFGFSLVEFLIAMSILIVLCSGGFLFGLPLFQKIQINSEKDLVLQLLHQARAKSMANIGQTSYGVYFGEHSYTLFSGKVFHEGDAANQVFPARGSISRAGMSQVVFQSLSGDATISGGDLILSGFGVNYKISINNVGRITWEN